MQEKSTTNPKLELETMEPLIVLSATGLSECADPVAEDILQPEIQGEGQCEMDCEAKGALIVGTEESDVLVGTNGSDVILGKGGDDVIYGDGVGDLVPPSKPSPNNTSPVHDDTENQEPPQNPPYYVDGDEPPSDDHAEQPVYGDDHQEQDTPHYVDLDGGVAEYEDEMGEHLPPVDGEEHLKDDIEPRSYDGKGNNLLHPEFGAAETELMRLADNDPTRLTDPELPSPREVSNLVHAQGDERIESEHGLTDYAWVWGQFIDHDITLTEGRSGEEANITVPEGDRFFDPRGTGTAEIEFGRSAFELDENGERQQVNDITAFVDASQVYGSSHEHASDLRSYSGGLMKMSADDFLPIGEDEDGNPGQFQAGDIRAGENVALTSMHTIFAREHNRIATMLGESDDYADVDMSEAELDEAIYQRARNIVAAQMQHITYNEFLPAILGKDALSAYEGYNPHVDPTIATEFSTAAFRFGHTMLSSELLRVDEYGETIEQGNLALRDAFFRPDRLLETGVDPVLRGLAEQSAQEIDPYLVDDVRNFLFGPPGSGGFDLASLNIQRGRDHELPSYNDVREAMGLEKAHDFSDVSSDPKIIEDLKKAYDSVDDMDLWTGGLAEDHFESGSVGETFYTIIVDQFERLRDGDRYWYERSLSSEDLAYVQDTDLATIIRLNSGAKLEGNIFLKDSGSTKYV